jgi:sugar O-acyltransferase (sialic acid O-acetyltransferase NeuD family)
VTSTQADSPEPVSKAGPSRARLYLAGTGSFAIELAEWAEEAGWRVAGLIELLDAGRVGMDIAGTPVVSDRCPAPGASAVVAVGGERREYATRLKCLGWTSPAVVHPRAHVSRSATIAGGTIVGPAAVLGAATAIAEHVLISRGGLVGHHAKIGAFASLLPGVNIGGHVEIGAGATLGMGAVVANGVRIGADATVAAGAVVLTDVASASRVQGVPARAYER